MLRTILKPFSFVPALLLMYMIFSFSAQEGDVSAQLSYKASVKIIEAADYIFDAGLDSYQIDMWANKINFITRKLAHMAEYFALAIAVSFPLYVYGMHGILLMLVAGLICVGFACGDEYHQSFVLGRSPSAKDVCIDSIGVFLGIILVRMVGFTGRKTIFRDKKEKKKRKEKKNACREEPYYNNRPDGPYYNSRPNEPYYNNRPDGLYYNSRPNGPCYNSRPDEPCYNDSYRVPPARANAREVSHAHSNPNDPFWQPEQEIDFNLKPEYPERVYMEENDPYDHDWGFDDPKELHSPVSQANDSSGDPSYPTYRHPSDPGPVKKKKKHEKDWFFDM